jgi:hypothetical protein
MVLPFQLIFSWNRTWAWLSPLGTMWTVELWPVERDCVSDMMDWRFKWESHFWCGLVLFNTQFVWFSTHFLLLTLDYY